MTRIPCIVAIAAALTSAPVLAKPQKVTTVEGITEYRLDNGLRVLLAPDPGKQTITVNATYLVGSRNEGYGETGMAHLLEHMLFKGTPKHPNIPQELTSHGARPNGSTNDDRTNYFEIFDASDENLKWALDLESDRMIHSFVARKDLDTEMTVVRNEYEMGENSPDNVLDERTIATAYLWHNYGHSTIGARSDIENVPIERLQAFYRTYYQPDNAVLVVSGRIDEAKALALVQKSFGAIPKPSRQLIPTYTREPVQDGERTVTLRRVGDVQVTTAAYHGPAGSHADAAPMSVLGEILGVTPGGALHKALVVTGKAARVAAYFSTMREPGYLIAEAQVRKEKSVDDARAVMVDTIEKVIHSPTLKEDVERAKASQLKGIDLTLRDTERLGLSLSHWIAIGDWRLLFLFRDRLRNVTADDVKRVALQYLKPSNRTVGVFIPTEKADRSEIPDVPDVDALVRDYHGTEAVAAGEQFDPSPANIESRVLRSQLASGMKLAILSKQTRGATVNAAMEIRYGDEQSLHNRSAAAEMAAAMLMRGTTQHTRQQLKDELDRLRARVSIFPAGPGVVSVGVETVRENFEPVMRLVAEILRHPSFPSSELDQLRQERLEAIDHARSDPNSLAQIDLNRHLSPYTKGDPRYVETVDEQAAEAKAVALGDLTALYNDLYGGQASELAVVGDVDVEATNALAASLFGDWKSAKPYARIPRKYFAVPATADLIETPDKENAYFLAGLNLPLRDDNPDYPALLLGNHMLGGGFLNSRLASRIRQKEGVSYGVGSWLYASPLDEAGAFGAYAIYAPQNTQKVEKGFDEELARALSGGFEDKELTEAKAGYLQSRQVNRAQDGGLARQLASYLFINRTLTWDADLEKKVAALSAKDVLAALQRHVDPAKISRARAGDFARVAKTQAASKP
jgi:zinc protease